MMINGLVGVVFFWAFAAAAGPEAMRARLWQNFAAQAGKAELPEPTLAEADGADLRARMGEIRRELDLGDKRMPYVFLQKGEKADGGWPLFINLHGGGANPRAKAPHAWPVNDREWQAQVALFQKVYPVNGLAFIPRMADDRDGRWYYGYVQEAVEQVIEDAILHHGVNPDKVYLTGISEGGYAAFRLASLMADRFAGSCAMAAAEPLGNAPPENLRHVAFRCGIGERDTMFDRIGLARRYFERLEELKKEAGGGYEFFFDEQKGRGHGIDYREGPAWVANFSRQAMPKRVTWTVIRQHDRSRSRSYWLGIDGEPGTLPLRIEAEVAGGNRILVSVRRKVEEEWEAAEGLRLRVYLPDSHLDLAEPVTVLVNGKQKAKRPFKAKQQVGLRSLEERGDPAGIYLDEVLIDL